MFLDEEGKRFTLPITGTTDASLLTIKPFIEVHCCAPCAPALKCLVGLVVGLCHCYCAVLASAVLGKDQAGQLLAAAAVGKRSFGKACAALCVIVLHTRSIHALLFFVNAPACAAQLSKMRQTYNSKLSESKLDTG